MAVPLPESDLVLLREHAYKDTNNIEVLIPKAIREKHLGSTAGSFEPVSEYGLGLFEYDLVNIDSISESGQNYKRNGVIDNLKNTLSTLNDSLIQYIILIPLILLCAYLIFWLINTYTSRRLMKEKADELEDQLPPYDKLESGSSTPFSYESETSDSLATPACISSYANLPEKVDSKVLINRLRID